MKVIFGDSAELTYLDALETEEYWGGSSRRTLTFTCAPDAISIDTLNTILSDETNIRTLALQGEIAKPDGTPQTITNLYEGYTMKLKVGIDNVLVQPESPDGAAVYADRLVFKLGKPTYIEAQLAALGITAAMQ